MREAREVEKRGRKVPQQRQRHKREELKRMWT